MSHTKKFSTQAFNTLPPVSIGCYCSCWLGPGHPQSLMQAIRSSSPKVFWCYLRTTSPGSEPMHWVLKDKEPIWNLAVTPKHQINSKQLRLPWSKRGTR